MPVILEVIMVVLIMLLSFFGVFLLLFLFAMALLPVEKTLSQAVWEMTAPPRKRKPPPVQEGGFKGFSQKQQQKSGR